MMHKMQLSRRHKKLLAFALLALLLGFINYYLFLIKLRIFTHYDVTITTLLRFYLWLIGYYY